MCLLTFDLDFLNMELPRNIEILNYIETRSFHYPRPTNISPSAQRTNRFNFPFPVLRAKFRNWAMLFNETLIKLLDTDSIF